MKFICMEKGTHTNGPGDNEEWSLPEAPRPMLEMGGETVEEVRQKLNAYLGSAQGIEHYGLPAFRHEEQKHLKLMPEGEVKTEPELATRNGHFWWWSFEIVEWKDEFVSNPVCPKAPVLEYEAN